MIILVSVFGVVGLDFLASVVIRHTLYIGGVIFVVVFGFDVFFFLFFLFLSVCMFLCRR